MSLDLTAIKARREKQYNWTGSRSEMIADIDALLLEVERLRAELSKVSAEDIIETEGEKCAVEGCLNWAEYEGWYRNRDFSGNLTGGLQYRSVCRAHGPMLEGWKD